MNLEKEWPSWQDCLGNTYQPGDLVAIAIINGKSPQLVIARVEKINRVRSNGEEITTRKWFDHEQPVWKKRTRRVHEYAPNSYRSISYTDVEEEYQERGEYRTVPSCTVKAIPIIDARGFHRWGSEDGVNKAVTYQIPENIVKLPEEG